jgi:YmgG-like glycine-zipper protein
MRTTEKLIFTMLMSVLVNIFVTTSMQAQRQYRLSDIEMRNLIRRIETRTDTLNRTLQDSQDRTGVNNTGEINRLVRDFEYATDQLRTRFESRQATSADARLVLERASQINNVLSKNRLNYRVEQSWRLLQSDLDQLARAFSLNWRWDTLPGDTSTGGSSPATFQLRQLVRRIDTSSNRFSASFLSALNRSRLNGTATEDEANRQLRALQDAIGRLRDDVSRGQASDQDAREVLAQAAYFNRFMIDNRLEARAGTDWNALKSNLDQLASAFNIAWNWSETVPGGPAYGTDGRLTGTFRLNSSQTSDARTAAENATRNLPEGQRQRVYDALVARLNSPSMLAIERRGIDVAIASSRAPQINLVADGREHQETTPNGRTIRVRASLAGDKLTITRTGERAQDFTVTFDPVDNGRRLLVTRSLYTDQLSQPVTVQAYYDRIADVAQLDVYSRNPEYPDTGRAGGDFIVSNGTELVAILNTNLSTQTARDNDRFSMTVRSPQQYEGATIEGYVSNLNRSGRVTGRAEMTLNFESIRLRDGRSYRFAGILESVRTPNNETVRVDNEGAVREDSQTNRTVTRTAIGTALGAIIGAIAGGGKGAAIGAIVGAGAGAGSVYVQGRDDLDLPTGTEVTVRASGPQ